MNATFLKNISFSFGTLLLSSQAIALEDLDKRVSKLEAHMNQVTTETALGTFGAKSTTANPEVETGVFLYGDVLYWHVYEGSTYNLDFNAQINFIAKNTNAAPLVSTQDFQEDNKNINFGWDFGFKLGLGYQIPHDQWELWGELTYFRTSGSNSFSGFLPIMQGLNIIPDSEKLVVDGSNYATKNSDAHWKLDYYNINLLLGRNYFISQYIAVRPFAGLQTAWIRQNLKQDVFVTTNAPASPGGSFGSSSSVANSSLDVRSKNRFWGIGPRLGFDAKWYFTQSVGIYTTIAGGIMWGEFDVTAKNYLDVKNIRTTGGTKNPTVTTETQISQKTVSHPRRIVANAQFDLGLSWDFAFEENDSHLQLKLGYENQYWWRQNYIGDYTIYSPDDLGIHGALFEVEYDF